jgi:hypothetical protein
MPATSRVLVLAAVLVLVVSGCSTTSTTAPSEIASPVPAGLWLVVSTGMCCHKIDVAGPPIEYTADCAPAGEYARYDVLQQAGQFPAYPEHSVRIRLTEQQFGAVGPGDPCPTDPPPSRTTREEIR